MNKEKELSLTAEEMDALAEEFGEEQLELIEEMKHFAMKIDSFEEHDRRGIVIDAADAMEMLFVLADVTATWSKACLSNEFLSSTITEDREYQGLLGNVELAKRMLEKALVPWPTMYEVGYLDEVEDLAA